MLWPRSWSSSPKSVSYEMAATLLFKGMTAQYLLRRTHRVEPGDVLLVHSAAGGVGQILTRWATVLLATVFGTTGSPEKRETALAAGCKEVLDLNDPQWPEAFFEASGTKARVPPAERRGHVAPPAALPPARPAAPSHSPRRSKQARPMRRRREDGAADSSETGSSWMARQCPSGHPSEGTQPFLWSLLRSPREGRQVANVLKCDALPRCYVLQDPPCKGVS